MRSSISLALFCLIIGCSHAAMQQIRSPVYPAKPAGPGGMSTTKQPESPMPAPATTTTQQAQAREGTGPVAVSDNSAAVSSAPNAQNYLVYYYPTAAEQQYRAGTTNVGVPTTAVQPYHNEGVPFLQRIPWVDVAYVVASLGLMAVGGVVVYTSLGTKEKARAMRELQDLDFGQVSDTTRRVLRAIEKFQNMNVENQ